MISLAQVSLMEKTSPLIRETHFFNQYAKKLDLATVDVDCAFNPNSREGQFILAHIPKNLTGYHILDIGCGVGDTSIFFAKRGAQVSGIDIAPKIIKTAGKLAKLHHQDKNINFLVGDICHLPYPDNSQDIVNGKAVLHHVDLRQAIQEVHRVLKPQGLAFFSDPLGYNPFIKIYEAYAKGKFISADERRLDLTDIATIAKAFSKVEWIGTDICSLPLFALDLLYLKLVKRQIPINWYERLQTGQTMPVLYGLCNRVDVLLPKWLQLLGWRVVVACQKD